MKNRGRRKAIVIDAALLEESDLSLMCDFMIFVNTVSDHRVEPKQNQPSLARGELDKRERFQMSLEDKRKKADYVIDNNFNEENTFRQIKEFWQLYIEKI